MRREADTAAPSSELAQTVAAVPPSVTAIGPALNAPSGANPPQVRGVSIVKEPRTRSNPSAGLVETARTQFVTDGSSACSRGITRAVPAAAGERQELTRMFHAASLHDGAPGNGVVPSGFSLAGVTSSVAPPGASGAMSPRRKRQMLARSLACPSGSVPRLK